MFSGTRLRALSCLALAAAPALSGCTAAPVVVSGAGSGLSFSMTSTTAYRAFTYPESRVHAAVLQALERMQIERTKDEEKGGVIKIAGRTRHLKIYVTLDPVTASVTKVSVNAKKNWFVKDQTVAVEILIQMNQALERPAPALTPLMSQPAPTP
jgi:hypothetical protein